MRDVYCTVALDQEEISRTQTVERTLAPFFGDEYQFEIPRKFRYLAIYVWDRDKHLKQDKAIGKIAIKREELHTYNHKDHWFPLRPVDADSEVQGMIHIKVLIDEGLGNLKRKSNFDESTPPVTAFGSTNSDLIEMPLCSGVSVAGGGGSGSVSVSRSESVKTTTSSGGTSSGGGGSGSTLGKTKSIFGHTTELSLWNSNSKKSAANTLDGLSPFRCDAKSSVAINVVECVDLAKKNGSCDPYVLITAMYTNKRKIIKRTKVRKKTVTPTFDETVYFDLTVNCDSKPIGNNAYTVVPLGGADLCEICVSVWHDAGMGEHIFLGEVKLPMRGKQQQNGIQAGAWYLLKPRSSQSRPARSCATPPGTRLSCDNSLGSMRLQLVYTADHVFPLANYDDLLNMLIQSVDQRPITSSAVYILGEVISNKTEVAQPLVRIFTYKNLISPMIKALADHEISKLTDPTTIFRGNTLVSKMMDEAMRLSGLHYLHSTLQPIVEQILQEKKPCEIDPTRVSNRTQIETNLANLEDYVEKVIDAITKSAFRCPAVLCQMFYDLRECAVKHFPDNKEVRYSVVSGFIFLRFFAPAILGPKLFDLTTEPLVSLKLYILYFT